MLTTMSKELAELAKLSTKDLKARYAEVFGHTPRTSNKAWLLRRVAWRLQSVAEGDISERARRRAAELANDADLRLSPPAKLPMPQPVQEAKPDDRLPAPGNLITKTYKGRLLQVQVLNQGFAFDGEIYPSLSGVAKAITGSHCNGYLFFGLAKPKKQGGDA